MGRCIRWELSDMAKEGMMSPGDSHANVLDASGLRGCCVSVEIRPPVAENALVRHQLRVSNVPEP